MFRFLLDRPTIFLVGLMIVCLLGAVSIFRIPVQLVPDVAPRTISIETVWPGATPADIEQEILVEQEQYLRGIPKLVRMRSAAEFGVGTIELEFPFGVDIAEALIHINNALTQVTDYPENVDEPVVIAESISDDPFMYLGIERLPGSGAGEGIRAETTWVDNTVLPRLEVVPGVASVRMIGGAPQEIHVYLDPMALSARQLTVGDVRDAIRARNRDVSGGDRDFGDRRYLVRTIGRFDDPEALNDLILARENGTSIRLRDVGYAELATAELTDVAFADGKPILVLAVRKRAGANVIAVKDSVLSVVEDLNRQVLNGRGLTLRLLSEDARYVERSIWTVSQNLIIGCLLVACVLFVFTRSARAALVGTIGVPMCVLASLFVLSIGGRSLNVISLSGIAFAIGMAVDNSILALESIAQYRARGKPCYDATLEGMTEVWPAILSSTLTTVMVFLPVIFLKMEAGELYSDIAVAISASIVMSMLVAMTIVPLATSRWSPAMRAPSLTANQRQKQAGQNNRAADAIAAAVSWILGSLGRQLAVIAVTAVTVIVIFTSMVPPAEYLPEGEESKVFAYMAAPPALGMDAMMEVWEQVDPIFSARVGTSQETQADRQDTVPPLEMNLSFVRPGFMRFVAEPRSSDDTPQLITVMAETLRSVPGMRAFATRGSIFSGNTGGTRSINIELSGSDLQTLYATSLAVLDRAGRVFEDAQINSDPTPPELSLAQPSIEIHPRWERASELGISQTELGYVLRAYADGAFADEYLLHDSKLDIYLRLSADAGRTLSDFENLVLYTGAGVPIPISAVAELVETVAPSSITHVDSLRTVTVTIIPPSTVALETGISLVHENLLAPLRAEGALPDSVSARITGASSDLDEMEHALTGSFLLAIVIAYLVLVAVFSSWGYPLIIMIVVPIGISGGLVGLWLLNAIGSHLPLIGLAPIHQPFDVLTMLGFLVLIGIVVNNPILIVEYVAKAVKDSRTGIAQAVEAAVRQRLRPIVITATTTIFGLCPLVLIPGAGSELYRGLGAVVLFGVLFSSLVSLTVLPVVLALALRSMAWMRSIRTTAANHRPT